MSVVIVDTTTVYVDQGTICRNGELVKVWVLADFARAQTFEGIVSWSATSQEEYDWSEERTRTVSLTHFSEPMGCGKVNHSDLIENRWGPVAFLVPVCLVLIHSCQNVRHGLPRNLPGARIHPVLGISPHCGLIGPLLE